MTNAYDDPAAAGGEQPGAEGAGQPGADEHADDVHEGDEVAAEETPAEEHPEPTTLGLVRQDNVTEPGRQHTHTVGPDGQQTSTHEDERLTTGQPAEDEDGELEEDAGADGDE